MVVVCAVFVVPLEIIFMLYAFPPMVILQSVELIVLSLFMIPADGRRFQEWLIVQNMRLLDLLSHLLTQITSTYKELTTRSFVHNGEKTIGSSRFEGIQIGSGSVSAPTGM